MTKHIAKRTEFDGEYNYRGVRIQRNDETPNGYWGRWSVIGIRVGGFVENGVHIGGTRRTSYTTMAQCKAFIDKHLDNKGE